MRYAGIRVATDGKLFVRYLDNGKVQEHGPYTAAEALAHHSTMGGVATTNANAYISPRGQEARNCNQE